MVFDFSEPITWTDIINAASTLFTLAAVIAAVVANCHASKSLKYSLKMQEQTKNVDLFDKRISVLADIKNNNETPELPLQLLFDETIVTAYKALRVYVAEKASAEHDMIVYGNMMSRPDGEGGYTSPMAELIDCERALNECPYSEDKVKEFDALCEKYQITRSKTKNSQDCKVYNYKDLANKTAMAHRNMETQKTVLLTLIQDFIRASISPVEGNRGKKDEIQF